MVRVYNGRSSSLVHRRIGGHFVGQWNEIGGAMLRAPWVVKSELYVAKRQHIVVHGGPEIVASINIRRSRGRNWQEIRRRYERGQTVNKRDKVTKINC